jgi:arabinose-5-phosphate isomerase
MINEAKRVIDSAIESLEIVKANLNEDFNQALELLVNANKVIISGVGKSGLIGRKIAATFSSIGLPSVFLHPVEALHGDIGIADSDDVAILLSKSGSTEEIVKLLPFLKTRSLKIISIVGNLDSYLARHSDVVLNSFVNEEACNLNTVPTNSTTATLVIGDALAVSYMKLKNVTHSDFSKQHPLGQLGRNLTLKVKDIMHSDSKMPLINPSKSFKEAIIEISKFGLGCICVINDDFDLLGFITDGDIRRTLEKYDDFSLLSVTDIMTKSPLTISKDEFLVRALDIMESRESQISSLPVIENNKVIGVIRVHDIIRSGL